MSWREIMEAGAKAVVDSGLDLVQAGAAPEDAARQVLDRKPVLTPSAQEYLQVVGLATLLDAIHEEYTAE